MGLPRPKELVHHLSYLSGIEFEGTMSASGTETRATSHSRAAKFANHRSIVKLDGHAMSALHFGLI